MNRWTRLPAATAALIVLAACGNGDEAAPPEAPPTPTPTAATPAPTATESPEPEPSPTPEPGPVEPVDIEVIATGLDVPWDLIFLDDGGALVSERNTARIVRVDEDGDVSEIGTVDGVVPGGEGGLLGLAMHEGWLYAYFTAADDNRVVRMEFDGSSLGDAEVVIDGIPKSRIHNGGRMLFGPDGMLYISTGDADNAPSAQDLDSLAGKILRVTPDGSVPGDNPADGSPVWSYGHRNIQGLAFDDDGRLWASEFGPDCCDGLHQIEPGENYRWPDEVGGRFEVEWNNAEASPSGLAYVRDTLFMAGLRGQRLWQIPLRGAEVGDPTAFAEGEYGRLRDASVAPDGTLWVLTNNTDGRNPDGPGPDDDRVLRITLE